MTDLDIHKLREYFEYDAYVGSITRIQGYGRAIAGQTFFGACLISCFGVHISIHRLGWSLWNGFWPSDGYWIDHVDRIKDHNWISNLRPATPTQNQQNKAGYGAYAKGVTWRDRKQRPWQAKIRVNGERLHLGSFTTEQEAAMAYREACMKYHGEFACHD